MVKSVTLVLAVALCAVFTAADSQALEGTPALTMTGRWIVDGGSTFDRHVDGFEFTPTTDIKVTALGFYANGRYGLGTKIDIAIFETDTKQLLTKASLVPRSAEGTMVDQHRYIGIAPYDLKADTKYDIVAFHNGYVNSLHGITVQWPLYPAISEIHTYTDFYNGTYSGPHYPAYRRLFNAPIVSGPNFLFVVPEPSSLLIALIGIGLSGVRSRT